MSARPPLAIAALALGLAAAGCGGGGKGAGTGASDRLDPTAPRFGPAPRYRPPALSAATAAGRPLPGLPCLRSPGARFGAHVEIFVDGLDVVVPAGIGVAAPHRRDGAYVLGGRCSYPLRTSDPSGVVEVRAGRRLTLGDLFAVWGQPLSRRRLLSFAAPGDGVRAFLDGRRWRGDPRAIPLRRHASVVLEVGRHVTRRPTYLFPRGL